MIRLLVILCATVLAMGLAWLIYYPPHAVTAKPTVPKASLQEAREGRTLVLRPDGCVELKTEQGRRTFIYQNRQWRECAPPAKGKRP